MRLRPTARDYFVLKPKHSGFHDTSLDTLLRDLRIAPGHRCRDRRKHLRALHRQRRLHARSAHPGAGRLHRLEHARGQQRGAAANRGGVERQPHDVGSADLYPVSAVSRQGSRVANVSRMAHAAKIASSSYWLESGGPASFRKLDKDITVDVAVVGGGITGLTAAYLLAAAGKSVAVLERGRCAQAETGQTTAHLSMVTDMRLTDLVKRVGRPHAQAAWDAGLAAIAQIDAAVRQHAIDCRFEWIDGYLHAPSPRTDGAAARGAGGAVPPGSRAGRGAGLRCRVRARRAGARHAWDPVSRPGAVSSPAVSRRPGQGGGRVRRADLRAHRGRRVCRRPNVGHGERPHGEVHRPDPGDAQPAGRSVGTAQRRFVPDQACALHQLRDRWPRRQRPGARRPVLGHRRLPIIMSAWIRSATTIS